MEQGSAVVMEVQRPRRRFSTRLSLRSLEGQQLVARVVEFCADRGVRHVSLLHAAMERAMEDPEILEAARLKELQHARQVRGGYRDRARLYRARKLL